MNNPISVDESTRLSMSIKLLWAILTAVALGAFLAAGVLAEVKGTRKDIEAFRQRLDDHERRLIRIEAKTMSSVTNRNDSVAAY